MYETLNWQVLLVDLNWLDLELMVLGLDQPEILLKKIEDEIFVGSRKLAHQNLKGISRMRIKTYELN